MPQASIRIRLRSFWSAMPSFLLSCLPALKSCPPCPMCVPKYVAILSFLGIELADYNRFLLPVMVISLAITLTIIYWQSRRHYRRLGPLMLAGHSAVALLGLKYLLEWETMSYLGMAGLFGALVWHQILMRQRHFCTSQGTCHH